MIARWRVGDADVVLVRGDITRERVDAIVNAANSSLMGGGGVDGAIHRAGGPAILEDCRRIVERIGRLPAGEAVITGAGELPARHVIHTVGPVWSGGRRGEDDTLAAAWRHSLALARRHDLRTIAFPAISTGVYRFPIDRAARIALDVVADELREHGGLDVVRVVLFSESDWRAWVAVARERLGEPVESTGPGT